MQKSRSNTSSQTSYRRKQTDFFQNKFVSLPHLSSSHRNSNPDRKSRGVGREKKKKKKEERVSCESNRWRGWRKEMSQNPTQRRDWQTILLFRRTNPPKTPLSRLPLQLEEDECHTRLGREWFAPA
ncbi:hypothetical protein CDAR_171321 [Caerostris darwini]|uniref:Uncharacterized protein n=1 Tax=Caerostris darwini TaxID=1538125 RepID=A0AAV4WQ78_9ARAC|nr:hypothetical protein CDAR_171321 [Caerostris darwini]